MSILPEKAKFAVINKFGGPDVFEVQDQKIPEIKPNQILIKVYAASINPIDWKQRNGNHKLLLGSPFPITLGYDVSGIVVKTGENIYKFKTGDEVFGVLDNKYGGAYGQFAAGTENCFSHIPKGLDKYSAAAYPMVALTAIQALRDKAKIQEGQTILINGASGGVGHIAVQIAKLMKAKTIAIASKRSESFLQQFEPDIFLDYTSNNILELDKKVDVFFDVIGNYSFPKTKHLLNKKGVYINLNFIDSIKKAPLNRLHELFSGQKRSKSILMKHNPSDLNIVKEWIESGKIKVHIDKEFALEEIATAHKYAQEGHSKGKNIVKLD
jgi:NADPH:quinone reductase-like Zn-dependent oxidoreductase